METKTALVGSNRVIVLDTPSVVGLDIALVIHPVNAEANLTVRDNHSLKESILFILILIRLDDDTDGLKPFLDGLVEFLLLRVIIHNLSIHFINIRHIFFLLICFQAP